MSAIAHSTVDVLVVSGSTFESAAMLGVNAAKADAAERTVARDTYFLESARLARERFANPLMVTSPHARAMSKPATVVRRTHRRIVVAARRFNP